MTEKKKKEAVPENVSKADLPLSQLMLDCRKDKYRIVTLAIRWSAEVKKRDQQSPETPTELLNRALKEVLVGTVSLEEIEKLPPLPKVEKKPELIKLAADKPNGEAKEKEPEKKAE